MCLSKNKPGQMAKNMAAGGGHVEIVQEVWDCVEKTAAKTRGVKY
jgi:hypothetical protein